MWKTTGFLTRINMYIITAAKLNANLRKKSSLTKAQRTFLIYTYFYLVLLICYAQLAEAPLF